MDALRDVCGIAMVLNTEQAERQHVFVCDEMKFKLQSPDERKK